MVLFYLEDERNFTNRIIYKNETYLLYHQILAVDYLILAGVFLFSPWQNKAFVEGALTSQIVKSDVLHLQLFLYYGSSKITLLPLSERHNIFQDLAKFGWKVFIENLKQLLAAFFIANLDKQQLNGGMKINCQNGSEKKIERF